MCSRGRPLVGPGNASPVSGRVLRIVTESEGVVASGAPLVEIGDPGKLEIVTDLLTDKATDLLTAAVTNKLDSQVDPGVYQLSPAELPPDMEAFKQQQYRWAKGGAQTARKLLPTVLRSRLPKRIKMEAFFHLTSCVVYPCIVLLTLMLYPVVYLKVHLFQEGLWRYLFDFSILLIATCSAAVEPRFCWSLNCRRLMLL